MSTLGTAHDYNCFKTGSLLLGFSELISPLYSNKQRTTMLQLQVPLWKTAVPGTATAKTALSLPGNTDLFALLKHDQNLSWNYLPSEKLSKIPQQPYLQTPQERLLIKAVILAAKIHYHPNGKLNAKGFATTAISQGCN